VRILVRSGRRGGRRYVLGSWWGRGVLGVLGGGGCGSVWWGGVVSGGVAGWGVGFGVGVWVGWGGGGVGVGVWVN